MIISGMAPLVKFVFPFYVLQTLKLPRMFLITRGASRDG